MRIRDFFLFRKYTLTAFVISLLLLALVLMSLRVKQRGGLDSLDALLIEICSPFQKGSTFVIKTIYGVLQQYVFILHTQQENELLKRRISELQQENHRLQELASTHERLRSLLQFREKSSSPMIGAEVIGQDPSSWFKSVTINRGEKDGLERGMAVVCPEGVIGRILKTAPDYAVVLLVTDFNSAVDAIVQRTRAKAIVEGRGENQCRLKYLLRTDEVAVGDIVVSSGLDGNFPKGLTIGEVRTVEKVGHGVFQYAELVPSVDLTKLEEVFVIKESSFRSREEKVKKIEKIPAKTKVPRPKGGVPKR